MTPDARRQALEQAALAGIHQLRIPTPFAVGRVNCYLLEDEPLTLIDTGPNSGKALDELQSQLAARGHSIDDLELVILTHQHIDHLGLVEIVVEHSGAEVAALGLAAERLAGFGEEAEREDEFAVELMLRNGIPQEVAFALQSVSRSFRGWGSRAQVTRPLEDGQSLPFRDRVLQALHRPGHSPSDTVFWDEERRILIAADHLIAHISSNPLIARPLDGSARAPAGARHLHRVDEEDQGDAGRDRPLRPRRADHGPRRADRRPPRQARAAQGEDLRPDRRAPAHAATRSPRRSGATSPSPRPSSPSPR